MMLPSDVFRLKAPEWREDAEKIRRIGDPQYHGVIPLWWQEEVADRRHDWSIQQLFCSACATRLSEDQMWMTYGLLYEFVDNNPVIRVCLNCDTQISPVPFMPGPPG